MEVADTRVRSCNSTTVITHSKCDFIAIFEFDKKRDLFRSDDSEKVFPLFDVNLRLIRTYLLKGSPDRRRVSLRCPRPDAYP
jgi:hypothetical protein